MTSDTLIVERDGAVAVVTINRPAVLNALNALTIAEIERTMIVLRDDPSVRAVVLTGAGEKAFVAGADIKELHTLSPVAGHAYARAGQRVFDLIEHLGKPVVAAINGFALGGGCELAMACTLRLAADTARLGLPEVKLGVIPGFGGTQRLSRLVGKGVASYLILTGDPIDAQEAWRIGLVNRVVPAADLAAEARALALTLSHRAPIALRYAIDAINHGLDMTFADGCTLEASLFGLVASTDDMREGTKAFLEKRHADFKGR
jgi:enoyl-CoA hydratase